MRRDVDITTVSPPAPPPAAIVRRRLLSTLDAALSRDGPTLVQVTAPPGYGKTTAVAAWCAGIVGHRVAWCTLGPTERARVGFWSLVLDAVDAAGFALPGDAAPNATTVPDRLASHLTGRGADGEPAPTVLVLDGLQHVDDDVRADLDRLLRVLSGPVSVVLVSRGDALLPAAERHRVAGTLVELRTTDLALTLEETARLHPGLDPVARERAWVATEGWPAVLHLHGTATDPGLSDDLLGEPWVSLSTATRRLLMLAAVPDVLPLDLAVELTGRTDSGDVLDRFARTTGLVARAAEDRGRAGPPCYRFHPVVRTYLRGQLDLHDRHAAVRAHASSADHFLRSGEDLRAVEHAVGSGDVALLDDVLASCGAGLVADGASEALLAVLRRWPVRAGRRGAGQWSSAPAGAWGYGVAALAELDLGRVAAADGHLSTARALAGERPLARAPRRPLDVLLSAAETHLRRRRGEATSTSDLVAHPPPSIGPDLRLLLAVHRGQALVWRGEWDAAERELTAGAALARGTGRGAALVDCLAALASVQASRSSVTSARQHAEEALRVAQARGWSSTPRVAFAHVLASWAAWQELRPVQARVHMDAALAVLDPDADPSIVVAARALDAGLRNAVERTPESALRLHATWAALGRSEAAPSLVAYAVLADLRSSLEVQRAGWVRDVVELARGRMAELGELRLVEALVAESSGQPARARELVGPVASGRARTALPSTRVEALGLRARIAIGAGDLPAAREDVESALDRVAELGCLRSVTEAGGPGLLDLLQSRRGQWGLHEDLVTVLLERAREPVTAGVALLTAREAEVLRELPSLRTVEEIAGSLCVSPNTVKTHLRGLYRKLGATSRREAIDEARRTGLL